MKWYYLVLKWYFSICVLGMCLAAIVEPFVWWGYVMLVLTICFVWYSDRQLRKFEEKEWLEKLYEAQ